jgi:hypothetical protein
VSWHKNTAKNRCVVQCTHESCCYRPGKTSIQGNIRVARRCMPTRPQKLLISNRSRDRIVHRADSRCRSSWLVSHLLRPGFGRRKDRNRTVRTPISELLSLRLVNTCNVNQRWNTIHELIASKKQPKLSTKSTKLTDDLSLE